ncbi:competence protein CoiA [Oceanobacillus sp. CF4.6]|uniref:competence protein CoiA n=1 Tax=Oceanobacillus sp. CF4.6 TaxID=3373080 RepID=UPI003EE65201
MLQAVNKNGRYITLATMKREVVQNLRKGGERFYCPVCKSPVIIKAGNQMIAHFAHQSSLDCLSREGGEGIEHEHGKLQLYEWLRRHNMDVRLEAYLREIQQRPDILLSVNNKQIAIEYQCARIATEEIQKRNRGYKAAGIFPIWIVGANHFRRYSANSFKLDQFTRQFIHQHTSETPSVLYYFHPYTSQFSTIQDIFIVKNTTAVGKITVTALHKMKFPDLFHLNIFSAKEKLKLWLKEKRQFRLRPRNKLYGDELTWSKWLYYKGLHPQIIPSAIHLPVHSQHLMKSPLWNWQSKIVLEIIVPLPIDATFSIDLCIHLLKNQIISNAAFPLIATSTNPIEQYLNLLEQLNYVQSVSTGIYQKKRQFHFYKNVEDAIKGDEQLLGKLTFQNLGKIQA